MRITQGADNRRNDLLKTSVLMDWIAVLFKVSVVVTACIFGYLLYGLFSGQLADAAVGNTTVGVAAADKQHVLNLINQLCSWLNVTLVISLICCCVLYADEEATGFIMLASAAFLAFGLQFCIDTLFAADAARLTSGPASVETLSEIHTMALIFAIPGVLLILRHLASNFMEQRKGQDLLGMTYGQGVKKVDRPRPIIPAIAKCWELPYCREGIRVRCPIFHAKTKCWKERVGCMCEENIILLAMDGGGAGRAMPAEMAKDQGFVPIGDLLTKAEPTTQLTIQTRVGPKGVRIPTNPHLTNAQKAERCRNCTIYNEHERQKYNLIAPIITVLIPAIAYIEFDALRDMLSSAMDYIAKLIGHLSFNSNGAEVGNALEKQVSGSSSIELIIIVCVTLVFVTWALKLLEYCTFKIKI